MMGDNGAKLPWPAVVAGYHDPRRVHAAPCALVPGGRQRAHWELYNLTPDYPQNNNLATKMPDELRDVNFLLESQKYNVSHWDHAPSRLCERPYRGLDGRAISSMAPASR
jgi:hypothetical protein